MNLTDALISQYLASLEMLKETFHSRRFEVKDFTRSPSPGV